MGRVIEEVEVEAGVVSRYRRHPNGCGLVSPGARVHAGAFVSRTAYVESGARVGPEAWIGPGSWIDHDAEVGARVFVGQNVHIGALAVVGTAARLGSYVRIGRAAAITPGTVVERDERVPDNAVIGAAGGPAQPGARLTADRLEHAA